MAIQGLGMTQPPARATWDDALLWIHPCAMGRDSLEVYPPLHCTDFEKPSPKANQALTRAANDRRRNLNL
jgi:hypothetical protein